MSIRKVEEIPAVLRDLVRQLEKQKGDYAAGARAAYLDVLRMLGTCDRCDIDEFIKATEPPDPIPPPPTCPLGHELTHWDTSCAECEAA